MKAGLENVPDIPAIYLGAFETTLKELTAAYTMFPNNGVRRQPYIIEYIEDRYGKTIYKATRAELRCIPPDVDYVMNELLRDVIRKGTATAATSFGLTVPSAGKTGTTDDYKDAWFIGYTTRLDLWRLGRYGQARANCGSRLRQQACTADLGGFHSERLGMEIHGAELRGPRQPSDCRALSDFRSDRNS